MFTAIYVLNNWINNNIQLCHQPRSQGHTRVWMAISKRMQLMTLV